LSYYNKYTQKRCVVVIILKVVGLGKHKLRT